MGKQTGNEAKLYRNIGTYGSPNWNEISNVRDLDMGVEKGQADASTRGSTWRQYLTTLKDATIDFSMLWDTSDLDFSAIQDAFFNDTQIELAILDGSEETGQGGDGLRATFDVVTFTRHEPLEDAMSVDVTLKPSAAADNAPEWFEWHEQAPG